MRRLLYSSRSIFSTALSKQALVLRLAKLASPQPARGPPRRCGTAGATPRRASPQGSARDPAALRESRRDPAPRETPRPRAGPRGAPGRLHHVGGRRDPALLHTAALWG